MSESTTTLYPTTWEQIWVCAESVVNTVANPSADAEIAGILAERALSSAQSALDAREEQQGAQATWRVKYEALLSANDEADEAIDAVDLACRLKGGTALQTLNRSLWGGEGRTEFKNLPFQSQILKAKGYLVRVDAGGAALNVPSERVEKVRITNAALEAAWNEEREAKRAWGVKAEAADQGRDEFLGEYRELVRYLLAVVGEARTRAVLPGFAKKKGKKEAEPSA